MNPHIPAFNNVVGHVMATLPDSFSQRKKLLLDVLAILSKAHPLRRPVEEMLQFLEGHEKHQLQLAIDFPQMGQPSRDGDGNGQNKNP